MAAAPTRPKPKVPPAKDPNVPRPHATRKTTTLLDLAAKESEIINRLEDELVVRRAKRKGYFLELERRDVSYRAMAAYHPAIPTNVTISRMLRADDKPPVV